MFGDGIDWTSPLHETMLYVELPFWLMAPPGPVRVTWRDTDFTVDICTPWMEVYIGDVTDSRVTVIHQGPLRDEWQPSDDIAGALKDQEDVSVLRRPCKTMLRISARAHVSAFRRLDEHAIPRMRAEQQAYWASLCEAHLPVVNELIQRYRLITYDYFPHEVSAWDVAIWYIRHEGVGYRASLLRYKEWDRKPVMMDPKAKSGREFEWTSPADISAASSSNATPGEFELLDARSLMERGDYTGAVRRTVTAIEAVLRWALKNELRKQYDDTEAELRVANTDSDFPGRLRQWRRLAQPDIPEVLFAEFETTRQMRHDIVHRALRLTLDDRGRAERAIDTSRWLYNKIEDKPDRANLRDQDVTKSLGRIAATPRFPSTISNGAILLQSFEHL